ncbi:hypothetical protein EVAR_33866_1 [Eumeta japonica]|uniref:Uncharacterized protein n=1 Tax=Eumeta variegata TaxID=151549 RepID=A0A4C1X451_EUMVA|nr:hypothetical protein EVAR_33866_1 [Eumeta japonica]
MYMPEIRFECVEEFDSHIDRIAIVRPHIYNNGSGIEAKIGGDRRAAKSDTEDKKRRTAITKKTVADYDRFPLSYTKRMIRAASLKKWQERYAEGRTVHHQISLLVPDCCIVVDLIRDAEIQLNQTFSMRENARTNFLQLNTGAIQRKSTTAGEEKPRRLAVMGLNHKPTHSRRAAAPPATYETNGVIIILGDNVM